MDATCLVGIQHTTGTIDYIAIMWDGEHVGEVLHSNYTTRDAVMTLIRGGSRPFLDGPDDILEDSDFWEAPLRVLPHQDFFTIKTHHPQYYYLFTTDNSWIIYSTHYGPHVQHENVLYKHI